MLIIRTSILSGTFSALDISVSETQIEAWLRGVPIQQAMAELTDSEREFIMTGITEDEWELFCQEISEK